MEAIKLNHQKNNQRSLGVLQTLTDWCNYLILMRIFSLIPFVFVLFYAEGLTLFQIINLQTVNTIKIWMQSSWPIRRTTKGVCVCSKRSHYLPCEPLLLPLPNPPTPPPAPPPPPESCKRLHSSSCSSTAHEPCCTPARWGCASAAIPWWSDPWRSPSHHWTPVSCAASPTLWSARSHLATAVGTCKTSTSRKIRCCRVRCSGQQFVTGDQLPSSHCNFDDSASTFVLLQFAPL